jgi:hypothetical protein
MNLIVALYSAVLFVILSPNVLLRIPSKGSKFLVAGVHAIVFGIVLYFTSGFIWRLSMRIEGFKEGAKPAKKSSPSAAKKSSTLGTQDNSLMKAEKTKMMADGAAKTTKG